MAAFTLLINGQRRKVEAEGETPLLWVLRDLLDLRGTKYGCGIGVCGACTVHVDGKAERSCQLTARAVEARAITTIEGLSPDGSHPCQRAWLEEDVAQCGFCQPGMIMTAAAALRDHAATRAALEAALEGHVCRCGTYTRVRRAIRRLVAAETER